MYGGHRDRYVLNHTFPTRRSSVRIVRAQVRKSSAAWSGCPRCRIEVFALGGLVAQPGGRCKSGPIFRGKRVRFTHEILNPHGIDVADCSASPCRETPSIDGTQISILRRGQHPFFKAARRFHRLRVQETPLEFLKIIIVPGWEIFLQSGPEMFLAAFGVVVKSSPRLAARSRSDEQPSELQSLMRNSYAAF